MDLVGLLIDGESIGATDDRTFERVNPITGDVATKAAAATVEDARKAADAAAKAFPEWSATSPSVRRKLLIAAADALRDKSAEIVAAMAEEIGATEGWSMFNIGLAADMLLEAAALTALVEHEEMVETLGFEIEPFGERTLAIRAVPALVAERDPIGLIRGLADELRSGAELGAPMRPGTRILEGADRLFATMACHSARRAGEVLDPREQRALLEAADAIPWAPSCPHGRPVAVPITLAEIERRFGRR